MRCFSFPPAPSPDAAPKLFWRGRRDATRARRMALRAAAHHATSPSSCDTTDKTRETWKPGRAQQTPAFPHLT